MLKKIYNLATSFISIIRVKCSSGVLYRQMTSLLNFTSSAVGSFNNSKKRV